MSCSYQANRNSGNGHFVKTNASLYSYSIHSPESSPGSRRLIVYQFGIIYSALNNLYRPISPIFDASGADRRVDTTGIEKPHC